LARRAAKKGLLAIPSNALEPKPANKDEARSKFQELKQEDSLQILINAFNYLSTRKDFDGNAGWVDFCWDSATVNSLAVKLSTLKAAVAFLRKATLLRKKFHLLKLLSYCIMERLMRA